jgi:hypothetical protein
MSMPPADPPPPAPEPPAEVKAAPAVRPPARRQRPVDAGGTAPSSFATEWTTWREERLDCAGCGRAFILTYKYRFVEGLAATVVRCPSPECRKGREYYLPVNAFDVLVTAADGPAPASRP